MEAEVSDTTLDEIIPAAINGDRAALDSLIVHPWTTKTFDEVSGWAEWKFKQYGQDRNDIRQILALTVYDKIDTVENRDGLTWCHCLKSWIYSVAKHHCWNAGRHNKVVKKHRDACAYEESARGKLKSTSGGLHALQPSVAAGPEQELLKKEQESLVQDTLRKLLDSLPPRHREIVELWQEGRSPTDTAAISDIPLSTIYRVRKQVQKALVKAIGPNRNGKENDA